MRGGSSEIDDVELNIIHQIGRNDFKTSKF